MTKYIVTGGTPLWGTVMLHGAKNAGFKAMIAALLANSPSKICDLGLISEIDFAKQVITSLGGEVSITNDPHCLVVNPTGLNSYQIPHEIGVKSRSSTMYVGPLLKKFGKAILPAPGGDPISKRPINRHIEGLEALGAKVNFKDGQYVVISQNGLHGCSYHFDKNTHTGTETLLMAAVCAKGITILENAAAEPEVDDLIKFLNLMGGKIERTAARTIKIIGQETLHGASHKVMQDQNEAVTLGCAALITRGQVEILGADKIVLAAFLDKVREAGGGVEISSSSVKIFYNHPLTGTGVTTAPYPGFKTDWQPLWAVLMTQAQGDSIVHETIHESRFGYVSDLVKIGAKIDLFNPKVDKPEEVYNFNLEDDTPNKKHAAIIHGPTRLDSNVIEIDDVRRGATMFLAALCDQNSTTILDPNDQIKRGYEQLPEQLISLGAKIQVVSENAV